MFNILCIEENDFNALRMLIVIFFIAFIISVTKGIVASNQIKDGIRKTMLDIKACHGNSGRQFLLSIIFIAIGGIIFANNVEYFIGKSSCGGEVNPILIFIRPIQIVVVLIYLGLIIFNIVKWIYYGIKNKERITKQELIKKVILYLIIAVVLFFAIALFEAMLGLSNKEGNFSQCWGD